MHSKENIENTIRDAIKDVTGFIIYENDVSLIGKESKILPASFIYIFDILEKELSLPVHKVFTNHTFDLMSVQNLTEAFYEMETRIHTTEFT